MTICNVTERETGIFSDLLAIDMDFIGGSPVLKGIVGDCGRDMYKPYAHDLCADGDFHRESLSGRPAHGVFPYFNLEYGGEAQGSYTYRACSCFAQMLPLQTNVDDPTTPWEEITRLVEEWRRISTYYYSDYYTLTEWNNDPALWRGYMYFDPTRDAGLAQLFRPKKSDETVRRIRFHGLAPDHTYHLCDTDGTLELVRTGRALLDDGADISLPHPLSAVVLCIRSISS